MAGWALNLEHKHSFQHSSFDLNLNYLRGTGASDALPAPEESNGSGSSRPSLLSLSLNWQKPFFWQYANKQMLYSASFRSQWNQSPLIPQDRFSIGGRYTVRGFDGNTQLSAERGRLFRNELSFYLDQSGHSFYLGFDVGYVSGPSDTLSSRSHLSGAFLGFRGAFKKLNYDLFIGQPLYQPDFFPTPKHTAGFTLNASF